jgi:fumarylpyruvate hydrolase
MNSMNDAPTSYVVSPPAVTSLPVRGTKARFPIRRVYCVGRNYAAHAIEMGHDPNKEPPFFFQKNPDNVIEAGEVFPYPPLTNDLHFEIELVVALGKGGANIPTEKALDHVFGYAVGLDMTRRDLQTEAKNLQRPWEVGKAFERSAPIGEIVRASEIGHPNQGAIWLDVDGKRRQSGDLNQLIWKVPEVIAHLSALFELAPGDIIMSGTPAGVGPVKKGEVMLGHVDGVGDIKVPVG